MDRCKYLQLCLAPATMVAVFGHADLSVSTRPVAVLALCAHHECPDLDWCVCSEAPEERQTVVHALICGEYGDLERAGEGHPGTVLLGLTENYADTWEDWAKKAAAQAHYWTAIGWVGPGEPPEGDT